VFREASVLSKKPRPQPRRMPRLSTAQAGMSARSTVLSTSGGKRSPGTSGIPRTPISGGAPEKTVQSRSPSSRVRGNSTRRFCSRAHARNSLVSGSSGSDRKHVTDAAEKSCTSWRKWAVMEARLRFRSAVLRARLRLRTTDRIARFCESTELPESSMLPSLGERRTLSLIREVG